MEPAVGGATVSLVPVEGGVEEEGVLGSVPLDVVSASFDLLLRERLDVDFFELDFVSDSTADSLAAGAELLSDGEPAVSLGIVVPDGGLVVEPVVEVEEPPAVLPSDVGEVLGGVSSVFDLERDERERDVVFFFGFSSVVPLPVVVAGVDESVGFVSGVILPAVAASPAGGVAGVASVVEAALLSGGVASAASALINPLCPKRSDTASDTAMKGRETRAGSTAELSRRRIFMMLGL